MISGFILSIESRAWQELGGSGGLTGFWPIVILGDLGP
jgi:hypothetical protein